MININAIYCYESEVGTLEEGSHFKTEKKYVYIYLFRLAKLKEHTYIYIYQVQKKLY